ncbi:MAG TPA: 4-alpha-glucanotransferase, partial [Casimicrobiaceae bacterium]|nr:4-alpha-glucanotransferase [Casimicrobiaceae bacterium]
MNALHRLAQAHGIALRYHDVFGDEHDASEETLRSLLAAMSIEADDDAQARDELARENETRWRTQIAPLVVWREHKRPWRLRLHLPESVDINGLAVRVVAEDDAERPAIVASHDVDRGTVDGEPWIARDLDVDVDLPIGYHALTVQAGGRQLARTRCAVAPARCYRPPRLRGGGRTFGAAVQLYGVRSRRNFGIGDFGDLATLVDKWGRQGAGIIGVNPLHALFPHNPEHASPYSPSSRLFVNALYLDVDAIPDLAESTGARDLVGSKAFEARLDRLRRAPLVDYPGVANAKHEVLALLYASFRERHLASNTARAAAFRTFQEEGGESLHRHALFETLQEHFHAEDASVWGWPVWPERYRDPRSAEVSAFAAVHRDRVEYFAYLQWIADLQRKALAERAADLGMAVGLYTDLAVSIDRAGAEGWANQRLYALGASVGAPPDEFNREGQDWGLPPIVPSRLVDDGFAPFIATLRANMRHAGALRIDHVMALMRLFWVPASHKPCEGAYVHYPFDEMLALVALESHRHRAMVIGEDLGTVSEDVREALRELDILSYRVLMFERDAQGGFKPPSAYPPAALATVGTHDLPTLAGWWEGHDIDVRAKLGLVAPDDAAAQRRARREDRRRLLDALKGAAMLPAESSGEPDDWPKVTVPLARAVDRYLASSPSVLHVVQLEDVLGLRDQANLPGTIDQHPNWRRKLPFDAETAFRGPSFRAMTKQIAALRPARADAKPPSENVKRGPRGQRRPPTNVPLPPGRLPRATYRVQLNRDFGFRDATALVPYLA